MKDPNSEAKVKVLGSESLYKPENSFGAHISAFGVDTVLIPGSEVSKLAVASLETIETGCSQSIKAKKCMHIFLCFRDAKAQQRFKSEIIQRINCN